MHSLAKPKEVTDFLMSLNPVKVSFNIEESALKDGMGLMAWLALQELLD